MDLEDLDRLASRLPDYSELRAQENRSAIARIVDGRVVGNRVDATAGASARAYKSGVWGFASAAGPGAALAERLISAAAANAEFLASRERRIAGPLPSAPGRSERVLAASCGSERGKEEQKARLDFARSLDAYLAARHPELSSRELVLGCLDVEKRLVTSDGARSASLVPRTILHVAVMREASSGGKVDLWRSFGGRGAPSEHFSGPEALHAALDELCEELARKAEGVHPKAGLHDVVLGSELAGILAHEAIGHTAEGDLVLGGSVAGDFMGEPVASELVTLVDFAHSALGDICPVPLWVDDEGTEGRDAIIIDRGVLRSYLHSKETASRLGAALTGNARAAFFHDEPLVRMRNTAILPGDSRLEELITSVDDGYYLVLPGSGQADMTGEFMFGVGLGYEIRRGKLGRALLDTTVSGIAFEMLKTVTMLSDRMSWTCAGMCGKKQMIPVGMGGPAIRCRILVGGR